MTWMRFYGYVIQLVYSSDMPQIKSGTDCKLPPPRSRGHTLQLTNGWPRVSDLT